MKTGSTTRRKFIQKTALATAGLALPLTGCSKQANQSTILPLQSNSDQLQIHLFSKVLQFLPVEETCAAAKEIGFDGLDLTIRPKGHVLPDEVTTQLPKFVDQMQKYGLTPTMFSSAVKDAKNKTDLTVLQTAKSMGFQYYRPAWIKYDASKEIYAQFKAGKQQLSDLAKLSEDIGIQASYQNHSGSSLGAAIWDFHQIASEIQSPNLGFQYDITHATIESGRSWATEFELIQPYITSVAVKDFKWVQRDGKWKVEYQPLGQGMVDIPKFFSLLQTHKMNVPMTLHVEYFLGGAEKGKQNPTMDKAEILSMIKADLAYVKKTWEDVKSL